MARPKIDPERKKREGEMLKKIFESAKENDATITQESLTAEMNLSQGLIGQWFKGTTNIPDKHLLWLSKRLRFNAVEFRQSMSQYAGVDSESSAINEEPALAEYTLESAPICESEYLLQLDGGMLPSYPDPAKFLCVPFDDDAKANAKYIVLRKPSSNSAVICLQTGPKGDRTILAELVDGRRVDHPDYLHSYDHGEKLCAIFDVVNDSELWSVS